MKKSMMKKVALVAMVYSIIFGTAMGMTPKLVKAGEENRPEIKNIIFLIGDGMGPSYTTAYRYLKDDPSTEIMEDTAFDPNLVGMQSVYSADPYHDGGPEDEKENIPDSAATATSMSSAVKTYNGAIAVDLEQEDTQTVLEAAKKKGKATGLVATSQITHATPAAFGSHENSRQSYNEIADDYYDDLINGEHKVDVLLGGGTDYFIRDDRNLIKEFEKDEYNYVTTTEELMKNDDEQLLGLFAPVGLDKAIDRPEKQPSLEQMTSEALETLSKDEDGFFLMVEGSQIDWAGHDNDVVGAMSEMGDFENAYIEAIEFAKNDEHTLVVATADHATGGFSIGEGGPYKWDSKVIEAAKRTPDFMASKIVEEDADIETILKENIEFELSMEEKQSVKKAKESPSEEDQLTEVDNAIENIFNDRSGTGWTTSGHTGEDVPVYAYGPGSEMFAGFIDNTEHAENIFKILETSSTEGGELADTATNYPTGILIGVLLLGMGSIVLFRKRTMQ